MIIRQIQERLDRLVESYLVLRELLAGPDIEHEKLVGRLRQNARDFDDCADLMLQVVENKDLQSGGAQEALEFVRNCRESSSECEELAKYASEHV